MSDYRQWRRYFEAIAARKVVLLAFRCGVETRELRERGEVMAREFARNAVEPDHLPPTREDFERELDRRLLELVPEDKRPQPATEPEPIRRAPAIIERPACTCRSSGTCETCREGAELLKWASFAASKG